MDLVHKSLIETPYLPSEAYAPAIEELRGHISIARQIELVNGYHQHATDCEIADLWSIVVEAHREGLLTFSNARSLAGSWQFGLPDRVAYPPELQRIG